jgi:hypothetical protein
VGVPEVTEMAKNITKTKTKRIISESSRKNITKTKTIGIISERNISSIEEQLNLIDGNGMHNRI